MILEINHKTIDNYVEFSFCLLINDLFYEKWDEDKLKPDGKEIMSVCGTLTVNLDKEKIEKDFWDKTNNVVVHHSSDDVETFIYLDLIRDPYDQADMILLGVRCKRDNDEGIRSKLLELYKKSNPRSNFEIDYFNQSLYRIVFNSNFYFYKQDKNKARRLIHYNLE